MATTQEEKKKKNIKKQRDRFLAFAFASADLFLEISPKGKVTFALGAAKTITGIDEKKLTGKKWLKLFAREEHDNLTEARNKTIPGMRCGPLVVQLDKKISKHKAIFTGSKLPNTDDFYITLSFHNTLMEELSRLIDEENIAPITTGFEADDLQNDALETGFKPEDLKEAETLETGFKAGDLETPETLTTGFEAGDIDNEALETGFKADDLEDPDVMTTGFTAEEDPEESIVTTGFEADDEEFDDTLYNKGEFVDEAERLFEFARTKNIEASMTMFDFGKSETIPEEDWSGAMEKISAFLREEAIKNNAVGEISEGQYSIIHAAETDITALEEKISTLSKELDPDGNGIEIQSQTITADLNELSSHEAARSLFHIVNEFEKSGLVLEIEGLSSGFKKFVSTNEEKLKEFKSIIERVDFDIMFQPIMNLKTNEADHYETLSRFRQGEISDWIKFGEDSGISGDFDLAVVERTLNYVHYKAATTRTKFSINISSKSIEQKGFAERLEEQLAKRDLKHRAMLEITDSAHIQDIQKTIEFASKFHNLGYKIALDDFSPAAPLLKYLKDLPIEFIKIDGKYIHKILSSKKNAAQVTQLVQICKKHKIKVIAECVEETIQADLLKEMEVMYAQGYFYGKAAANPSFVPPSR